MKTITSVMAFMALSLLLSLPAYSQVTRAFNQNSSRSNHTKALSIYFSPVYTTPTEKSGDSLLFRGTGAGVKFGADYFFSNIGLGIVSGFGNSMADDARINDFLKRNNFPQDLLVITKSAQQSMYLLMGPSARWGKAVQLYAHAKGGLFINNGGLVNIQQKGAQRSAYRNEATGKSIYPGFQTGLGIQYSNKAETWSFGFGADYLNTKTQVQNYDLRRGGAIEGLKLTKTISDLMAGITVRYTIQSPRDVASGQATGKRTYTPRDIATGQATGKRTVSTRDIATGQSSGRTTEVVTEEITIDESGVHRMAGANCGPVTQRVTAPDGTVQEMTFACPADASAYQRMNDGTMPNRISMNVTVPKQTQGATFGDKVNQGMQSAGGNNAVKQTQGATFGEKVNQGLHAAGGALAQGKNIISGNVSWATEGSTGIVTNNSVSAVSGLAGGGSGAAAASYAATGRSAANFNPMMGSDITFYSREAGSGMASGRREKGSGMATGRRQYEPLYRDGSGSTCETCSTSVKLSSIKNNPLYKENNTGGVNPMYNSSGRAQPDLDGDGFGGLEVLLKDPESGAVVARTITEASGDFFFANVPDGDYIVAVIGMYLSKKGYDYYSAKRSDLMGTVEAGQSAFQIMINTGDNEPAAQQKAGISTSRSNIRNKTLTIIEADTDGDGEYESVRANATFSDGGSADITSSVKKSNAGGAAPSLTIDEWGTQRRRVEVLKSNKTGDPNANRLTGISVSGTGSALKATGTFSDGSKTDITESIEVNTAHNGVRQYSVTVGDLDGDGQFDAVLKTRTKSNQTNERMAATADENEIWSPRSNIKTIPVVTGDLDGDGTAELLGGSLPGGAVISALARPGNPIGGLTIKGGKNPGGNLQSRTTNEKGEFEFTDLEEGSYTFTVEQKLIINDETLVSVGSRVQDHNSSRSNKSADGIEPDPGSNEKLVASKGDVKITASQNSQSLRNGPIKVTASQNSQSLRNGTVKVTATQNSQSLRTISVVADLDGDGVYETDVTSKVSDELIMDKDGNITAPQQKAGISTSRSNIRNKSALQAVTPTVFTVQGDATVNGKEVQVQAVYKVVEKATSGLKDTLKTQV